MPSSKNTSHVRSFSWPPESSHPIDPSIEHFLLKLRNSEEGPSSFSASSICQNLGDIKGLYQAINNSIECPLSKQVLSFDQHRGGVEEALEGSLFLLDACGSANDILSLMKESILELESSRRRKSEEEGNSIGFYMLSRKQIHTMANKCLKNLRHMPMGLETDGNYLFPVIIALRKAQCMNSLAIKSVVAYLSSAKTNRTGRSLAAKLMHSKHASSKRPKEASEVEKVGQAVFALEAKKLIMNAETVNNLLKQLETLELVIRKIEECLESVSRCLLQTRVSLLNVLSH